MSLKSFEQAWLELLLNPRYRAAWLAGDAPFHGLTSDERESLRQLESARLEALAAAARLHRSQALARALPLRIKRLLGPERAESLLAGLSDGAAMPALYPRRQLLSQLLNHLLGALGREGQQVPHLRDLVAYELASADLDFFALPRVLAPTPGPMLAPWARLIRLGSQFSLVLERLNRNQLPEGLDEEPRQRFLLTREFRGLRLEALPVLVQACLELCDGARAWPEIMDQALAQQPGSESERASLQAWLEQFLQRGVLLKSTDAETGL